MKFMRNTLAKTLLLLVLIFASAGCSSDDNDAPDIAQPVAENILGKWYSKGIKLKGEEYQVTPHLCPESKNYTEFTETHMIQRGFNAECESVNDLDSEYVLDKSYAANDYYDVINSDKRYKIIKLTGKELILRTDVNGLDGFRTDIDLYYTKQ